MYNVAHLARQMGAYLGIQVHALAKYDHMRMTAGLELQYSPFAFLFLSLSLYTLRESEVFWGIDIFRTSAELAYRTAEKYAEFEIRELYKLREINMILCCRVGAGQVARLSDMLTKSWIGPIRSQGPNRLTARLGAIEQCTIWAWSHMRYFPVSSQAQRMKAASTNHYHVVRYTVVRPVSYLHATRF